MLCVLLVYSSGCVREADLCTRFRMNIYVVISISLQTFFVQAFKMAAKS